MSDGGKGCHTQQLVHQNDYFFCLFSLRFIENWLILSSCGSLFQNDHSFKLAADTNTQLYTLSYVCATINLLYIVLARCYVVAM